MGSLEMSKYMGQSRFEWVTARSVWKTRPKKPRPSRDVVAVAGSEDAGVTGVSPDRGQS
jgi:hypothetical protein